MNKIGFPGLGLVFQMNEIAIPLPILNGGIRWYALILLTGILVALTVGIREAKRTGEDPEHVYNMVLWALPIAIICARLYYVVFSFSAYRENLWSVFYIWEGGIAIYGGIIGALLTVLIYCKKHKLSLWKYLDIGAFGFLVGQSIGRWGNFVNGEAYGTETTLPWRMLVDGMEVHPTFLYESLWNMAIFLYLWCTRKKKGFAGRTVSLYMIGYGIGRFFIEGLRTDSLWLGNIRISQLVSLAFIAGGSWLYMRMRKKAKEAEENI